MLKRWSISIQDILLPVITHDEISLLYLNTKDDSYWWWRSRSHEKNILHHFHQQRSFSLCWRGGKFYCLIRLLVHKIWSTLCSCDNSTISTIIISLTDLKSLNIYNQNNGRMSTTIRAFQAPWLDKTYIFIDAFMWKCVNHNTITVSKCWLMYKIFIKQRMLRITLKISHYPIKVRQIFYYSHFHRSWKHSHPHQRQNRLRIVLRRASVCASLRYLIHNVGTATTTIRFVQFYFGPF